MLVILFFSIIFILGSVNMQDSEKISKLENEVKVLKEELNDIAIQLGGVFLDEQLTLKDCSIIDDIESLENDIPRIKGEMNALQEYNQVVEDSQEKLDECNSLIKDYNESIDSILEKLGIEFYSYISEKELEFPEINSIYKMIKEGEGKSEQLETRLYKEENSVTNKSLINKVLVPFRIKNIKNKINKNSRDNLGKLKKLGSAFTRTPELSDNESRVSIIGIYEEYNTVNQLLQDQLNKKEDLKKSITHHKDKIKEGSNGLKLSSVYLKLEKDIVECQNMITKKLEELGHVLFASEEIKDISNKEVLHKVELYNDKMNSINDIDKEIEYFIKKIEGSELKKKIASLEKSIESEENKIKELRKKLSKQKKDVSNLVEDSNELDNWLEVNSKNFEA